MRSVQSRRGGVERDAQAITAERVLKAAVPAGSRFKGYEDIPVRDLRRSAEVIRHRRERWLRASGETVVADYRQGSPAASGRSCGASCWPCTRRAR